MTIQVDINIDEAIEGMFAKDRTELAKNLVAKYLDTEEIVEAARKAGYTLADLAEYEDPVKLIEGLCSNFEVEEIIGAMLDCGVDEDSIKSALE